MKRRLISALLVLAMIFSCMPMAFAAETANEGTPAQGKGPVSLTVNSETPGESSFAPEKAEEPAQSNENAQPDDNSGLPKYELNRTPFSQSDAAQMYAADDMVTFIVVLEQKPLLDKFMPGDISKLTPGVKDHQDAQLKAIRALQTKVTTDLGKEEGFKMGYTYTIATTGFSVTTAYGNREKLASMEGVERVYVAPVYSLPQDQGAQPYTNNASTMIGADVLNATGFTGKGMRIAILDTGIKVDHPSFAALSEEQLADPLTAEDVEAIWKQLNAGQSTAKLNLTYHNTKIPYAFNYDASDFNVDNTYVGSDHGTHVAGIAAGNKLDSTNVVGVAPEAQLLVMQCFAPGGGAGWDVILAALEDCVRLEVDAVNLSLGAAAGFTDPEGDMLEVMKRFQDSDILLLIAAGNDTNNAYANAWGYNMSLITNPDTGLTGTPSTYSAALSIASVENDGFEQLYITVNGRDLGYQDTAYTTDTNFLANFRAQELEFVFVPGIGAPADYEGYDVAGKVAVVSRGDTSFPEKQAAAQEAGAIACIVYNNTPGIINMQITDGEGNIPCISVSQSAGAYLEEQYNAGNTTLTVCDADTQIFKVDRQLSDFSTWGVTPDLKLKPELSGVGGNIYSATHPSISGSNYGTMSGTSMATPQIAGAMAVLKQYINETYPDLTDVQVRQLAANLLMSTAVPVLATAELEVSPRGQGAGVADLVNATTTPAYLSNPAATEGRPKVEFGDDDAKNGVYSFTFEIHNLTANELVYNISSSVFTEEIAYDAFIAGRPYGLEAEVVVEGGSQVTVPGNGSVTVSASITLTENDKAYLNRFPNGIYVEGFVYATPEDNAEGLEPVELVMPMVGFYGDWSAAPIYDETDVYSLYPQMIFTNFSQVGYNPYIKTGRSGEEYNVFSYANPLAEIDVGQLRNVKKLVISAANSEDGTKYFEITGSDLSKSYYSYNYGMVIPFYVLTEEGELWNGLDADGNKLPDGTTTTVRLDAWLDDGDDVMDDSIVFDITLDDQAPQILNANDLQSALRLDEETGHIYLDLEILDNRHAAALLFESVNGSIMGKQEVVNVPGETLVVPVDITAFGDTFTIVLGDYACNEVSYDVVLDLSEFNVGGGSGQAQPLDKDRIYGSETYSSAAVEPGWFSASKADLSGPRNETYDTSNIYYAAEYVNGYLIGQNAGTGNLEFITPAGSYWSTIELIDQGGQAAGKPGTWVLYDMALDHSGSYKEMLDPYDYKLAGTDALFGMGWQYEGDNNNDGHDDGANVLWLICLQPSGYNYMEKLGEIQGVTPGFEMLTFAINADGQMYGIATDGFLYTIELVGDGYGSILEVNATPVGDTKISQITGGNPNVIQSMGFDHNTGKLYWFAHVQTLNGYVYSHYNMTYTVDLETAQLTEVGSYGAGGQTALFIPNDLQSDLFTLGVDPTSFSFGNIWETTLVEGASQKLNLTWDPWNCTPGTVTWSSEDETVASVDQTGKITAHVKGQTTISAVGQVWDPYANYNPDTGNSDGGWTERTVSVTVNVVESQPEIYAFIVADYVNQGNQCTWVTYSDTDLKNVTQLNKPMVTIEDPMTGETATTDAIWQGGAYYQGYVYTVMQQTRLADNGGFGAAAVLYRTKVTRGATPAETTFGEPEEIGYTMNVEVGNMSFDYNTGRMYGVDLKTGGLCIIDLDTGSVDSLGEFSGDIGGAAVATAMTVTADGTIYIADMASTIYTVDPDTLVTRRVASADADSWYYAGMGYDYNTGNIYWNPCHNAGQCPFYMILVQENEWGGVDTKLIDMGDVSSKEGVEQCVIFTIPENEPETNHIPVESITIDQGEKIVGLQGGNTQLTATTNPLRPTVQTRTWTSSDESVVTVDRNGNLEYVGVGTATITVSTTNKDEATHGGPFTDTIEIQVLEAAGEFVAFLGEDAMGTSWYDFWLKMNDYDLRHASPVESAISIYSINTGAYFDGYFYAYDKDGNFLRINAENVMDYKLVGPSGLDYELNKVAAMAFDYTTGTMYGITHRSDYNYVDWTSMEQPNTLVTIDLTTGALTEVAVMDYNTPVYSLACDENGVLYAAGSNSMREGTAHLYTLDKETGALSLVTDIAGCNIYSGPNYYGPTYNPQMTYDFASKRLYINATTIDHSTSGGDYYGVIMVQLGEEELTIANLGGISIYARDGANIKKGHVYLGLMAFIPEASDLPECPVVGVQVSKTTATTFVGGIANVEARVQPMNAADPTLVWTSADESIATVDGTGNILGVSVGTTTVTVASQLDPTKAVEITVNVIDGSGASSIAYTASEQLGGIVAFDPALPAQTASKIFKFDGANNVHGMAMGDGCLYYVLESGYSYNLYRFDLLTGLSAYLGTLETFGTLDAIAYDSVNNVLYGVGGFYLFQYNMEGMDPSQMVRYSNYMMDSDYCTLAGVACIDGAVYTIGTGLYNNSVQLMKYSDKYLNDRTVLNYNVSVNTSGGATEMHYDERSGLFYISDAGHNLYTMDQEGNCTYVDILGNGIDIHGIAISSADHYRITFTDGVADEEIFADQTILAKAGSKTPVIAEPVREGYALDGWTPELAKTVTGHASYSANWVRDYGIEFYSISTSLGGNIAMNFYVDIPAEVMNDPSAAMQFTFAGRTITVPLSEGVEAVKNDKTVYRYSCLVTSKHMADTITAQVINETGAISKSKSMSVRGYCDWVIANYSDGATVNLMKAMLNYGASAQLLFDHNVDDLANVNLSEADKVLNRAQAEQFLHSKSGEEEGIKPVSYTLLLDSETSIRLYFELTGDKSIDEFTFTVDGEEVVPTEKDGRYYIEVRDIAAHKLDVMHTFTCGGITIQYSALSYVNQVMVAENSGETYDMACALFAYWQAAENYIK